MSKYEIEKFSHKDILGTQIQWRVVEKSIKCSECGHTKKPTKTLAIVEDKIHAEIMLKAMQNAYEEE